MSAVPYRPSSYYRRQIAINGTEAEARAELRAACMELERLRAWVREQGLIPPVFTLPREKVCETLRDPLTEYQDAVASDYRERLAGRLLSPDAH